MKIVNLSEDQAKKQLSEKLAWCRLKRERVERSWDENELTVFNSKGTGSEFNLGVYDRSDIGIPEVDGSNSNVNISYAFKNLRFIHAQLSANPPSVVPRPATNDQEDRRRADSADQLVRHAIRQYKMQENIDQASLDTLVYGTGFMKGVWDSSKGDILEMDEETGELKLEGDISFDIITPWNMFIDPDATKWEDVRYVFEKIYMPYEDAIAKFGEDKKELIDSHRYEAGTGASYNDSNSRTLLDDTKYNAVEMYEYWEPGLPHNGYLGRFTFCSKDGDLFQPLGPNPHRFTPMGKAHEVMKDEEIAEEDKERLIKRIPKKAKLPYHIFTDIDVPHQIWGKSFLEYITPMQDTLNRLDTAVLDNVKAHGIPRVILPEGAEIADDSLTNSAWDVMKITGTQPPHFMGAAPQSPDSNMLRDRVKTGIDDLSGVNESMFGQQSREQSGFSMQYATNQGNMIRRRLFNKYVMFVESIYKNYLNLVRKHWDVGRTIQILGNEKALYTVDIKGADIDGGWDLVVEYGASLSLDPMTRREEILSLQPLFEKAGVSPRTSLQMMKLNELEGMYGDLDLANDRQREIFEKMIATNQYIAPEEYQDHVNMLVYAKRWTMTREFTVLDADAKKLITQHITDRGAMAANEAAPAQAAPAQAAPAQAAPAPQDIAAPIPTDIPEEEM